MMKTGKLSFVLFPRSLCEFPGAAVHDWSLVHPIKNIADFSAIRMSNLYEQCVGTTDEVNRRWLLDSLPDESWY
jgi:hypothetical protein